MVFSDGLPSFASVCIWMIGEGVGTLMACQLERYFGQLKMFVDLESFVLRPA